MKQVYGTYWVVLLQFNFCLLLKQDTKDKYRCTSTWNGCTWPKTYTSKNIIYTTTTSKCFQTLRTCFLMNFWFKNIFYWLKLIWINDKIECAYLHKCAVITTIMPQIIWLGHNCEIAKIMFFISCVVFMFFYKFQTLFVEN